VATFPVKRLKRVRIVKRADGCQFAVETQRRVEHPPTDQARGIDIGLKSYYTDSDGKTVANPRTVRKAEHRLKRLHRQLSRTKKGSVNRQKARKQLAKAYLKVSRQPDDFARKTANALVSSSDFLAYEDLKIRNLVRNRHLSKSISDASWGKFLQWVKYYGTVHTIPVIAVPPQFTTQDCSACGTRVNIRSLMKAGVSSAASLLPCIHVACLITTFSRDRLLIGSSQRKARWPSNPLDFFYSIPYFCTEDGRGPDKQYRHSSSSKRSTLHRIEKEKKSYGIIDAGAFIHRLAKVFTAS
jgi:IS605 OrfB family transposase